MVINLFLMYTEKSLKLTQQFGAQAINQSQKVTNKSASCFVSCMKYFFHEHDEECETNHQEELQNNT